MFGELDSAGINRKFPFLVPAKLLHRRWVMPANTRKGGRLDKMHKPPEEVRWHQPTPTHMRSGRDALELPAMAFFQEHPPFSVTGVTADGSGVTIFDW